MAIKGATNIYAYTSDSFKDDSNALIKWLSDSGVEHSELRYNDTDQLQEVYKAINSWFPNLTPIASFPFVVYTEVYDGLALELNPKKRLVGLKESTSSNLAELAALFKV